MRVARFSLLTLTTGLYFCHRHIERPVGSYKWIHPGPGSSACVMQDQLSAVTSAGLPRHCPGPRATIHGQTASIVDTVHQALSFEPGLVFLPWMY